MRLQKTLFILLGALFFLMSCNTKKKVKETPTIIKGTYTPIFPYNTAKEVTLYKIVNGIKEKVVAYPLKEDGKYEFTIPVIDKESFYVLGSKFNEHYPVYVKNNQVFTINVDDKGYTQENIPDQENTILYNWKRSNDTLKYYNGRLSQALYKEFFPFYESYMPKMKSYHDKVNTKNKKFNALMHAYIDLEIEGEGLFFVSSGRFEYPSKEQTRKFLELFKNEKNFESTILLELPKGREILSMNQIIKILTKEKDSIDISTPQDELPEMVDGVKNDTLKAFMILDRLIVFKSYQRLDEFLKPYQNIINIDKDVKQQVEAYKASITIFKKGSQGFDFTAKNEKGKEISFSSLKGKYVYIDNWATWCGPCKDEIPALKQLEKDFHGKDIQFVSISMDKPKDLNKWKKYVKENNLGGIQLFAGNAFKSEIAKHYGIKAIPRFMLFGKEGKIIDVYATRPSDLKQKNY